MAHKETIDVEVLAIAERWLNLYAGRVDGKVSKAAGDMVRSSAKGIRIARESLEGGTPLPDALIQADVDMWTKGDATDRGVCQIFYALGKALKGETP